MDFARSQWYDRGAPDGRPGARAGTKVLFGAVAALMQHKCNMDVVDILQKEGVV